MPAVFLIDHLPVDHFTELNPAVILYQVTAEGKDKILNTELSIVDISYIFGSLMQENRGLDNTPLHLLNQIHEEDFEFSLYSREISRTVATIQQTLLNWAERRDTYFFFKYRKDHGVYTVINMKSSSNRNSSIELIKVIAIILIIFSSAAPYGVTYSGESPSFVNLNYPSASFEYMFFLLCRWCGQIGDTLFIVSSAWFLCESKHTRQDKILLLIMASWIYSVIGLVIALPFLSISLKTIIQSFLPITFKRNWFVGCYILYYAIHPYINTALEGISSERLSRISLFLFVIYSIFPQINHYYYFTELIAFITIHIIVTSIKKNQNSVIMSAIKYKNAALCFLFILIWIVGISLAGSRTGFLQNQGLMFCNFYNPVIIILSIFMVILATKHVWFSLPINYLSSKSLLIYLAHCNYFWISHGKYWIYDFFASKNIPILTTWMVLVIFYLPASVLIGALFNHTVSHVIPCLYKKVANAFGHKI